MIQEIDSAKILNRYNKFKISLIVTSFITIALIIGFAIGSVVNDCGLIIFVGMFFYGPFFIASLILLGFFLHYSRLRKEIVSS